MHDGDVSSIWLGACCLHALDAWWVLHSWTHVRTHDSLLVFWAVMMKGGWVVACNWHFQRKDPTAYYFISMSYIMSLPHFSLFLGLLIQVTWMKHPVSSKFLGNQEGVLTEITQPCVHTCDGLFICQLYLRRRIAKKIRLWCCLLHCSFPSHSW
jgi:hypothetical protein